MTATAPRVGNMVFRIQTDFLDDPTLCLTLQRAQQRFGFDRAACVEVLTALVDARVLTCREGAYSRYFPRVAAQQAA